MHRILVVAASPKDSSRLRLGEEVRDIQEGLRRSRHRDHFDFVSEWAVGARELRRALLDYQPEFVHFSGHGTEQGIALEDDSGETHIVGVEALAELFSHFAAHVRCVLLNACHSQLQAEAISRVIPYAIGMQGKIVDKAAIEFSVGFYDAVGAGRDIDDAFAIGRSAIHTSGLPGHSLPVLNHHPEVVLRLSLPAPPGRADVGVSPDRDIVGECLSLAPEPYKSIIQRRKDEGWFGTVLNGFQKRYTFSEDQFDTVTIVAFRAACDPDSLDSMMDILIAEADVSYEQAVKIQRDIAHEIILPIKDEGDRLVNTRPRDNTSFSTTSTGPTGSRGDDALFQNDHLGIMLTSKLLKYRAQTFPTHSITNVAAFEGPFELMALIINGIIALIGINIVLAFSLWSLLGLGMVALGAFNVKEIVTKKYIVTVKIRGAADLRFEFTDKSMAITLRDAFQQAMAAN